MSTWTQSAATKSGLPIWRKPALTSIDHDSQIVTVSYHEAVKVGDDYISVGDGSYTLSAADSGTATGQITSGAEQVIAVELAMAVPGGEQSSGDTDAIETLRVETLYSSCMLWQSRPSDPHTCDSNFFALLTSIKAVARIAQVPVATKAAACLSWLDTLWADYYTRKATGSTDYDFSSHGGCPHSFVEVREEAGE